MNENHEHVIGDHAGSERVGDTIRRERLERGIQIETVAYDLKLSADYIRALEESCYSKLPAPAYARVYIKAVAGYLGLSTEDLLERFSREQNIEVPDPERERRDTISVKVQGTKKNNPFLPMIYLAAALVLVILLIKNGRTDTESSDTMQDSLKIAIPADTGEAAEDSLPAVLTDASDSASAKIPAGDSVPADTAVKAVKDTVSAEKKKEETKDSADVKKNSKSKKDLSFKIQGKNDSSWVKIFADGKKVYDGIVTQKKELSFKAKDSLNFMIGKNGNVAYKLNGAPLNIEGSGLKVLRVTGDTIELWRMSKWNSVFDGR